MTYYISKKSPHDYETTLVRLTDELKKQGFGVLTEINIHEKLKEKLGVEFRRYKILGVCNPRFAYEVLQVEEYIGVLLPCSVIVQEKSKDNVEIAAINPLEAMASVNNPKLEPFASKVYEALKAAVEAV
jgi:uncharacterized protein (DUF302 family)